MDINPNTKKIYLAGSIFDNHSNSIDAVYPIDYSNKQKGILSNVTLGEINPYNIAIDTKKNIIYGSSIGNDRLFLINGQTDTFTTAFVTTNGSDSIVAEIAVDPNRNIVYMANEETNSVSLINGTNGLISEIP